MKKIGILIYSNPDYYPPTVNAVHLLSEHFDVVLICRNQDPSYWEYPSNVTVHRLGQYTSVREREQASSRAKLWEYINFVSQASHFLKDVSLIYAYDAFGYTAACLCRLLPCQSVPIIYHNHDINDNLFPVYSLSRWVQFAERNWANKATVVVFPAQDRSSFFQRVANLKEQPIIVPNFPRKSFVQAPKDWVNTLEKRFAVPQILLQGAISTNNSMLELIESLIHLNNSVKIKLIGTIRENEHYLMVNFAEKKNVTNRVEYLRYVPYTELLSHTWTASIGVCLYKKININNQTMATASNKIYEYAACGLPVIVSDFPNYREYLSSETWVRFANPDDPDSIASAVQDILSDLENYKAMCIAARQAFEEKFNYEYVFTPLLSQITNLVESFT